jgi:Mg-chelatase subunit ChlD
VQSSSYINGAGYRKKYGYLTLVNYWLEKQAMHSQTPDLWKTSEQPITAVKNAVRVFLDYIQEVKSDDQVGLAVYTYTDGTARLETGLTRNMQLVEDISRQRQAGHYDTMTNIGAGLQKARLELENNARHGAFKMIVLMTDGIANRPYNETQARNFLLQEAQKCAEKRYNILTVSLGAGADTGLMQQVADITGGIHFNVPGGQSVAAYEAQLKEVFKEIAAHRPLRLVN